MAAAIGGPHCYRPEFDADERAFIAGITRPTAARLGYDGWRRVEEA